MKLLRDGNPSPQGKMTTTILAGMLATAAIMLLPGIPMNADGYMTPGMGMTMTFEDLVLMSGGAVTGAFPFYQVHENIIIMPSDTLQVSGGLIIQVDPGMDISIEILGTLDGFMGMGTLFHSGGPGTWRGISVYDSGSLMVMGFTIFDATDGMRIDHSMGFGMVQISGCVIDGALDTGITMIGTMGGPMVDGNLIIGSQVGISLKDTSAQCMNNEVWNCGIGFREGRWPRLR